VLRYEKASAAIFPSVARRQQQLRQPHSRETRSLFYNKAVIEHIKIVTNIFCESFGRSFASRLQIRCFIFFVLTRVPNRFEKIGFSVYRFIGFWEKAVYRFFGLSVF